jgi:hypothetical protein
MWRPPSLVGMHDAPHGRLARHAQLGGELHPLGRAGQVNIDGPPGTAISLQ